MGETGCDIWGKGGCVTSEALFAILFEGPILFQGRQRIHLGRHRPVRVPCGLPLGRRGGRRRRRGGRRRRRGGLRHASRWSRSRRDCWRFGSSARGRRRWQMRSPPLLGSGDSAAGRDGWRDERRGLLPAEWLGHFRGGLHIFLDRLGPPPHVGGGGAARLGRSTPLGGGAPPSGHVSKESTVAPRFARSLVMSGPAAIQPKSTTLSPSKSSATSSYEFASRSMQSIAPRTQLPASLPSSSTRLPKSALAPNSRETSSTPR